MIAVDVGYGQLAWSLQTDERVTVMDRTNVRDADAGRHRWGAGRSGRQRPVSFISLTLVLPALVGVREAGRATWC